MERGVSIFGLVMAGLLTLGCSASSVDDDDDDDETSSRCESLCEVVWDCDTTIDVNACNDQCELAFDVTSATCEAAFEEFTNCADARGRRCDSVATQCESSFEDFALVCDQEIDDIDVGGGEDDPCVAAVYNSCLAFDGYCDEGSGACLVGTDYADCYC